jgi:AAA15 family ATPase/GTPase
MILKALKYKSSWLGDWSIVSGTTNDEFVKFENINLIVGRNASGKTRLIDAIRWISDLFEDKLRTGLTRFKADFFEVIFQDKKDEIKYNLTLNDIRDITSEILTINNVTKLDRKNKKLFYEKLGENLDFETDSDSIAISRRDKLQQPFFEILHQWGKYLAHFSFGGNMGKGDFETIDDFDSTKSIHFKNSNNIGLLYYSIVDEFKPVFEQTVIEDMIRIDYHIKSIRIENYANNIFIGVQEDDLIHATNFGDMSQGMARAFSLIVQLNYSLMAKIPSCILIDDIGEGLDYDRSKKLIELIIEKAEGSNIQVFMTTNDRFVMNSVPLKYWSVIHREGNKSVFYNYQNSKQTFDDFAFTGLNNFDFFATEFYRQGFEEFIATAQ